MTLTLQTLLRCFLRTYFVAAAFNTRGMQNIGMAYAIEPALAVLYPGLQKRAIARQRYIAHYNTHPFWTPMLLGCFIALEMHIASGRMPAELLEKFKNTSVYTLSAIGDSLFGGTIIVTWGILSCMLLLAGQQWAVFLLTLGLFLALQIFKLVTFGVGLRKGLGILQLFKQWDLINWSVRIKYVNAALAAALVWHILPKGTPTAESILSIVGLAGATLLIQRLHFSRTLLVFLFVLFVLLLPFAGSYVPVEWNFFNTL